MVKFGKLTKIDLYFFYYVNYSGFCIWNFLVCKMCDIITTKVCARPPNAPVPKNPKVQDQANLRTFSSTLYDFLRNPKFLRGITVDTNSIDTLARNCAGPSYPPAKLMKLVEELRIIGILGSNETVVPFSLVKDERVVPYPDNLVSIALQVINNEGCAIYESIYIFETFKVSRVKV